MAQEKNIRLDLAYDGTKYHGWQRQKNEPSIQGILEDKIETMTGSPVNLIASGRTDAGVHALNQVCHFKTTSLISPEVFQRGLNALLPQDIHIHQSEQVSPDFHARYSAKSKTYEYRILNREHPDVFQRSYCWHLTRPLDIKTMTACLTLVQGKHDFSSFKSTGSANRNPVRQLFRAALATSEDGMLRFLFEADGFLRHMVRNLVGTIVEAGLGDLDTLDFQEILFARDRRKAGIKAPPQGLFLRDVKY
jgi:tRNA pseudouridine38-40 synthase